MWVKETSQNFTSVGAEEWIDDSIGFSNRKISKVSVADKIIVTVWIRKCSIETIIYTQKNYFKET